MTFKFQGSIRSRTDTNLSQRNIKHILPIAAIVCKLLRIKEKDETNRDAIPLFAQRRYADTEPHKTLLTSTDNTFSFLSQKEGMIDAMTDKEG